MAFLRRNQLLSTGVSKAEGPPHRAYPDTNTFVYSTYDTPRVGTSSLSPSPTNKPNLPPHFFTSLPMPRRWWKYTDERLRPPAMESRMVILLVVAAPSEMVVDLHFH